MEISKEKLQEYKKFYEENGFLLISEFIPDQMDILKEHIEKLVNDFFNYNENQQHSIFSTIKQEVVSDKYFLESGDKIRFFFEEGAFDEENKLIVEKKNSINKIGHALELDPIFEKFTYQPAISNLIKNFLKTPLVCQTMYIFKQPKIGGYVSPHQDSTFIHTKPHSSTGFWFAVEDVTLENGCLWVVPGSHKYGIKKRFKRKKDLSGTYFTNPDPDETWTDETFIFDKEKSPDKWIPLPCKKGSLIIIHGDIVHMSERNTSSYSRHAYTIHFIEKDATYDEDNWLQRPKEMPFKAI